MSPIAVLLVLLVVAYVGGMWASARHSRSFGSPSGVEYAVLGILLGPHVLGALGRGVQRTFEPLSLVALSFIALCYGLDCGMVGRVRARFAPMLIGVGFTAVVMSAVGFAIFTLTPSLALEPRLVLAMAVGLVSAESTRYGVRRVGERHAAAGPLYRFLNELAAADDAPALLAVPFLYAALADRGRWLVVPSRALHGALLSIAASAALGALAGWLIARTSSRVERWTILLGSTWLAAGSVELVGGSAMGACFALGAALSTTGAQAPVVRRAVARAEGPVLLPALLLAGAYLEPLDAPALAVVGLALLARVAANFAIGAALSVVGPSSAGGRSPFWLGFAMQSSGTLSMVVGFGIALRWPGASGNTVLACAIAGTLLGELVGPYALRRALFKAGELGQNTQLNPPAGAAGVAS